jgi:hypothetical protein
MTDLGVVDPLRPPAGVVAFVARVRALPPYALGFLGVLAAKVVADLYTDLRPYWDSGAQFIVGLLVHAVPEWLMLLAPVAVAWSAARRGAAQHRVLRGAITVGLSEVVAIGAGVIGHPENPTWAISAVVRSVSFALLAVGLVWMARGLESLRSAEPSVLARRGAVLGVVLGLAVAGVELVARIAQMVSIDYAGYSLGEGQAILITSLASMTYLLVPLAWAYLAWALVRADRDPARPPRATRLGAWAGWFTIAWLGASLIGFAWLPFTSARDVEPSEGLTMLSSILLVVVVTAAIIALAAIATLIAALAAGLASGADEADMVDEVDAAEEA